MKNRTAILGIVVLISLILIPAKNKIYFPAESRRIGPLEFNSALKDDGTHIFGEGHKAISSDVQVRCKFRVSSRPEAYAILFSTGLIFPQGIAVTLSSSGNLYLQVESLGEDPYQLLVISGPLEIKKWHDLELNIRKGPVDIKIKVNGNAITPVEARDGKSIDINQMNLRTNAVTLGGTGVNQFNGRIREATFVMGVSSGSLDLGSMRFLVLLLFLWITCNILNRKNQ